jgi:flavodoxin
MKTLVAYTSQTGNTEKIAHAIFSGITGRKVLQTMSEIKNTDGYDIIYAGFPIYNFEPVHTAKDFLHNIGHDKKVILFMTMALTAAPVNDQNKDLYQLTINNCRKCILNSELLGVFDCPGELSEVTANALLKSNDPMLQGFGSMRHYTIGYPNEENILSAKAFAENISSKLC